MSAQPFDLRNDDAHKTGNGAYALRGERLLFLRSQALAELRRTAAQRVLHVTQ